MWFTAKIPNSNYDALFFLLCVSPPPIASCSPLCTSPSLSHYFLTSMSLPHSPSLSLSIPLFFSLCPSLSVPPSGLEGLVHRNSLLHAVIPNKRKLNHVDDHHNQINSNNVDDTIANAVFPSRWSVFIANGSLQMWTLKPNGVQLNCYNWYCYTR